MRWGRPGRAQLVTLLVLFILGPAGARAAAPSDTEVNIDFVDAELGEVIKYFAETTGRNFLLAERMRGKLTIISPVPVTVAEAYEAFLSALHAAGYAVVEEGLVLRVVKNDDAVQEPIPLSTDGVVGPSAGMVTRIIRLQNVSAEDLSKIASKMTGDGGTVVAYAPMNSLIVTDTATNLLRIEELLSLLDVHAPTSRLEIIAIQWADAVQVVEQIKAVFAVGETKPVEAKKSRQTSRRSRRKSKKKRTATPSSTSDQVGSEVYIGQVLADERTNSVIIRATDEALVDVREFIARIDFDVDLDAKGNVHVVYLEHADAEDLAQVLSSLVQDTHQQDTRSRRSGRSSRTSRGRASRATTTAEKVVGQFQGQVEITADAGTNGLVIMASPDDFRRLDRVIRMLDIRRKQVFVEAVILEISDSTERDTGVGFHSGRAVDHLGGSGIGLGAVGSVGGGSLLSAMSPDSGLTLDLSGLAVGMFGSSLDVPFPGTETGTLSIPAFGIVITAMESDTNTEVLSSPNLLTMDNEEAEIVVGQTIPFSAGFTTTTQGMPIANFSREDVALTLRITPQINEGDTVTLEVFLEITEVVPESRGADLMASGGVTTTKRSAETMVSVNSSDTVVLGGLMQTNQTLSEDKVPVLGDVPLLGGLFRSTKKTDKKTNLLVFLTPHVIDSPEDLQEVYSVKMLQREEFMRRFYGKTLEEQQAALQELLLYSMNLPGRLSPYDSSVGMTEEP